MTCDPQLVVCQLERIAAEVGPGWDWNSFWQTVLATAFGASLALAASWLLAVRGERSRYRERVADAAAAVITSFTQLRTGTHPRGELPTDPVTQTALASVLAFTAQLKRRDLPVAIFVVSAFGYTHIEHPEKVQPMAIWVINALDSWLRGSLTSRDFARAVPRELEMRWIENPDLTDWATATGFSP